MKLRERKAKQNRPRPPTTLLCSLCHRFSMQEVLYLLIKDNNLKEEIRKEEFFFILDKADYEIYTEVYIY